MHVLLDQLREVDVLPLHLPMPRDQRLARICATLVSRPDDASTAEQWANRLRLTSKTIHRLFARETGMTFGEWRQQARLLFALERLARGARVVDVALDAGYASSGLDINQPMLDRAAQRWSWSKAFIAAFCPAASPSKVKMTSPPPPSSESTTVGFSPVISVSTRA